MPCLARQEGAKLNMLDAYVPPHRRAALPHPFPPTPTARCLRSKPAEQMLEFSADCMANVVNAYCPIIKRHKDDAYTPEQKQWQAMRRGRYVEFNLVYDRWVAGRRAVGQVNPHLQVKDTGGGWVFKCVMKSMEKKDKGVHTRFNRVYDQWVAGCRAVDLGQGVAGALPVPARGGGSWNPTQ